LYNVGEIQRLKHESPPVLSGLLIIYGCFYMEVKVMVANVLVGGAFAAVLVAKWMFFSKAYGHKQAR
jgi:hypothetical protein